LRFEKVLITGAAGLLGRAVVRELAGRCGLVGLDLWAGKAPITWHAGDVTDAAAVHRAMAGCDAVLHLAAMPNIWSGPGERIMRVNVMGTWQVLAAAEAAGVRRVVLCSSDSVVGFTVREGRMLPPLHLPIDLGHPLRPTEPYGLSKLLGEETGRSFANRGLEVVVLRPVFVAYPEMAGEIVARARDPQGYRGPAAGGPAAAGGGPCWHHVDPRDAARAFRLALELAEVRFATFFVSAAVTLAPEPTLERLARALGHLPEVRRPEIWRENPHAPLYDLGPTRDVLGLAPEHDARHLISA
jgi:nucleoside-diphosphate-sugar epimerase